LFKLAGATVVALLRRARSDSSAQQLEKKGEGKKGR